MVAPTRLPSSVRIGAYTYTVSNGDDFYQKVHSIQDPADILGMCDSVECLICLRPGLPPQVERNSFLHELLHAAKAVGGHPDLSTDDPEEAFISATTHPLLMILRDNPKVVAYLLEP
jgi:hypothetical protein